tara:strand:+ start:2924 stop:3604 length:681 start_codon:yes stop_codon:yes gene_type:complete
MNNFTNILENGIFIKTSGTTGIPKLIFQPINKIKAANSVSREVQHITKNSRILTVCKIAHAGGLLAQTLPAFEINAHVDIQSFNPYTWVKQIINYTHSHLAPSMADAIIKTKNFSTLNLSGIVIMCGSDKVHCNIIQAFIDRGATFIVNWGMTEVGPVAINKTYYPGDTVEETTGTIMGDSLYCDTKIVDNELYVRGDICVYDNWFATSDYVVKEEGTFYYISRKI